MKEPDFLVVGTARAGTTALQYYLHQHPEIFLPSLKEPCYYSFAGQKLNYKYGKFAFAVTDKKEYGDLFSKSLPGQVNGDISTPYLYLYEQTISNIKKNHTQPAALKILIILRNPVDRAYSQYLWKRRDGRENLSFDEALKSEKKRMEENYSFDYFYAHRGLYYQQVKAYTENFKSVKIYLYEDFKTSFASTMKDMCEFINVDPEIVFTQKDGINKATLPRFAALGKLITVESKIKFKLLNYLPSGMRVSIKEQFNKMNSSGKTPPPVSLLSKKYLRDFFKEDILKLQSLIGKDLSSWLNP